MAIVVIILQVLAVLSLFVSGAGLIMAEMSVTVSFGTFSCASSLLGILTACLVDR